MASIEIPEPVFTVSGQWHMDDDGVEGWLFCLSVFDHVVFQKFYPDPHGERMTNGYWVDDSEMRFRKEVADRFRTLLA